MNGIVFRPYRAVDEPALLDLFRAVYGPEATQRTSAWRYLAPSPYPAVIQVAEADARIVGAQPSHAIDLLIGRARIRGLLLLDVMTHPDYRRRGVFAGVVEGLRERAIVEGYRVLLTTPNRDAERGFARLPAWRRLGELEPWLAMGDPAALLGGDAAWAALLAPVAALRRRMVGSADGAAPVPRENLPDPVTIDAVASGSGWAVQCQTVRDARFLGWRFGPGSGRPYRFFVERIAASNAIVVTCVGQILGRDITFLVDVLAPDTARENVRRILGAVVAQAVHERRAAVVGWFAPGSPVTRLLETSGFWKVPRRFRPRPYSVIGWTDLAGAEARDALDSASWHMTLTDSDLA